LEYCFAIVANDKIIDTIREVLFEVLKIAKINGSLQKVYVKTSNKQEVGIYLFRVSRVSPRAKLYSSSVDYIAILESMDDDSQEAISKLLRERGVLVFRKGEIDISFFVDKMPSVINLEKDRGRENVLAVLLNDITRLLAVKRETMYRILKSKIKNEDMDLVEAYRMVNK